MKLTGRIIELKAWPEPFQAVVDGRKRFEIRRDDRGFAVGDVLRLEEFDPNRPSAFSYTGRRLDVVVRYMVPGGAWELPPHLCVMSIRPLKRASVPAFGPTSEGGKT